MYRKIPVWILVVVQIIKECQGLYFIPECSVFLGCFTSSIDIQGIHKIEGRFQKWTRNLFLTLHGHNVHRQQRQLAKFLMRYQQFALHVYCGAAGPVSKMGSQQEKVFCVFRFEVSFVHGLEKTHHASFLNCARNSRCTVITDLDTSKRSTQKAFTCCDAILETGPAAPP